MKILIVILMVVVFGGCAQLKDILGVESATFTKKLSDGSMLECVEHETDKDLLRCTRTDDKGNMQSVVFNTKSKEVE